MADPDHQMSKITWLLATCRRRLLGEEDATELMHLVEDLIQEFEDSLVEIFLSRRNRKQTNTQHLEIALETFKMQLSALQELCPDLELLRTNATSEIPSQDNQTKNQQKEMTETKTQPPQTPPLSPTSVVPGDTGSHSKNLGPWEMHDRFAKMRIPSV